MQTIVKSLAIYLAKKYAASFIFDMLMEAAAKAAKKSSTQIDDELVESMKKDKQEILSFLK